MSIDNLTQLKALSLFRMATALAEIQAEAPRLALMPEGYLHQLIDAEIAYTRCSSFYKSLIFN